MELPHIFKTSSKNGNESLITKLLRSEKFLYKTLACKIEKRALFPLQLMHLLAVLCKIPSETYLNINKLRDCVWSKILRSQKFWMTQTDGSSQSQDGEKWDSRQNLRGMKFERALEDSVSLREKEVDEVTVQAATARGIYRLKTCILWQTFLVLCVYFTEASELHEAGRSLYHINGKPLENPNLLTLWPLRYN